jgi:D-proline reductase (dithiol) PrdB
MEHGVSAPRVGFVPFPYNLPMGRTHDREEHRKVALAALALLHDMEQPGEVSISASQHFS